MGLFIFFLVMVIVLALAFTGIVALWVYKDAKARGERGWLWVCIVLLSSPLLGGLLYLLARRDDRRPCRFCGWMVDKDARFCSRCGKEYPVCDPGSGYQEDLPAIDQPARRRNRRFLAAVLVSAALMIVSLVGMIVSAVMGTDLDTGIEWNTGWVMMNVENTWDNVWTFRYNVASEDYHTSSRLEVEDPQTQQLRVDLQFEQGESMRMTITQEREDGQEIEQEYFVESDSAPQYFPLDDFEAGKIRVRFYNNGVSDVEAAAIGDGAVPGSGLVIAGGARVPFVANFPGGSALWDIFSTSPDEAAAKLAAMREG